MSASAFEATQPAFEKHEEDEAEAIARKYSEQIPPEQRDLHSSRAVEDLLYTMREAISPRGMLSTGDKLGNLPGGAVSRAVMVPSENSKLVITQAFRQFSANLRSAFSEKNEAGGVVALTDQQVEIFRNTDKINKVAKGELPPLVRDAILKIVLDEGPLPTSQVFSALADMFDKPGKHDYVGQIRAHREAHQPQFTTGDKTRARALQLFVAEIFPNFVAAPETKFDFTLHLYADKGQLDAAVAAGLGKEHREIVPTDIIELFTKKVGVLTDEENSVLREQQAEFRGMNDFYNFLRKEVINPRLVKRFVEKKTQPEA